MQMATWSPGFNPAARSTRLNRFAAASSSAYVWVKPDVAMIRAGLSACWARWAPGNMPRKVADRYRAPMGRTRFAELMDAEPNEVPLDEAALEISARLQPGLDRIEWLAALDLLAGECPTPTADGVARFLFHDEHFVGNRTEYGDWRNSCLDRVIATRTGLPITLSIVMIEVARRVGVPLVGVGMPAHFIVGSSDDERVYFDPFGGGTRLDHDGARELFTEMSGGRFGWEDSFLDPTPPRDVIIRVLNNLKATLRTRGDALRLGIVMGLRGEVAELAATEEREIAAATSVFN